MIDSSEADDKIVAVLDGDYLWGKVKDIKELPSIILERLQHYFLTYKLQPDTEMRVKIEMIYGRDQAYKVIQAAMEDYLKDYS